MHKDKLRVLVADDDRRMVKTLVDILRVKGFETAEAHSGQEAVAAVRENPPDCVLMDIKMPGINGVEALRTIKAEAPGLPVVLMTAYTTDDLIDEGRALGADQVLTKPIDVQMVLAYLALLRKEEGVLVVDDDPNFARTLKDILQARGFNVTTEANPEKVLDDMAEDYKLVVLLDLKLGNVDGVDVLRDIRDKYPSKPVVLVTGYRKEMADAIQKGIDIGAYTCLYKPLEVDKLLAMIGQISTDKRKAVLGAG